MSLLIEESMKFVSNKWQIMNGNHGASFYDNELFAHFVVNHDVLLVESELREVKRAANKELVELVLKHFNNVQQANGNAFVDSQNDFENRLFEIASSRTAIYDYINKIYGEYVYG